MTFSYFHANIFVQLLEENGQDPIITGFTFYVRYLGSCFVVKLNIEEATAEALESNVHTVKLIYD